MDVRAMRWRDLATLAADARRRGWDDLASDLERVLETVALRMDPIATRAPETALGVVVYPAAPLTECPISSWEEVLSPARWASLTAPAPAVILTNGQQNLN